ncbi:MAG: hypothetical protein R3F62_15410, partial [Planctomycetota bacterium]
LALLLFDSAPERGVPSALRRFYADAARVIGAGAHPRVPAELNDVPWPFMGEAQLFCMALRYLDPSHETATDLGQWLNQPNLALGSALEPRSQLAEWALWGTLSCLD